MYYVYACERRVNTTPEGCLCVRLGSRFLELLLHDGGGEETNLVVLRAAVHAALVSPVPLPRRQRIYVTYIECPRSHVQF